MDEADADQTGGQPPAATPRTVGETLRAAREVQGLSLPEICARTRVPLRHLEAIETADYAALPSPTYAVGFARAYARAVGVDEVAIAKAARIEVDLLGRRQPEYEPYEVTDPSRVPSRGVAIVAAGLALGLLVLAALYFGSDWLRSSTGFPTAEPTVVATRGVPPPTAAPTRAGAGEVVLSANDEVWMRVYDAADTTLYTGTLQPGERFVVPAGANDPRINVGRPDKLAVTLNGAAVPPLGTGERAIRDVRIGAEALAARIAGTGPATSTTTNTNTTGATTATTPPAATGTPLPTPSSPATARPLPSAFRAPPNVRPAARAVRRSPDRPAARRPRPAPSSEGPENLLPSGFYKGT